MSVLTEPDGGEPRTRRRRTRDTGAEGERRRPRRARGRRTYKPAAERREQILGCALEAFAEGGYHQTSIADVCARAGIGRGTLYQYFADKRALLVALGERIVANLTAHMKERQPLHVPEGMRPTEAQAIAFIEQRLAESLRVVFEDAATARVIVTAGRGVDGAVDEIFQRVDDAILSIMESELEAAVRARLVRPVDVRLVSRFLLGGVEKLVVTALNADRPVDVAAITHEVALLEARGLLHEDLIPQPPDDATRSRA